MLTILYNYLLGHESRCLQGVLYASSEKAPHPALRKQFRQKKSQSLERKGHKGSCIPTPVEMTSNFNRYQLMSVGHLLR